MATEAEPKKTCTDGAEAARSALASPDKPIMLAGLNELHSAEAIR